jgi:DNA-directed RNA polymerase specialized sigma24 family protein
VDLQAKISILRRYEVIIYSTCRYLLEQEQTASAAAKETLIKLFADSRFWQGDDNERQSRVRRCAAKQCLSARMLQLSAVDMESGEMAR